MEQRNVLLQKHLYVRVIPISTVYYSVYTFTTENVYVTGRKRLYSIRLKVLVHFRILKKSIFFCIFQLLRPLKIFC